jgi:hypothetical protein
MMPNALQEQLTTEERRRRIAEAMRMFELPPETIDHLCHRMNLYVEKFLCPPTIHLDFRQFSGLPLAEIEKIQRAFSQMGSEIREWKDSIFRDRLLLEVAIAAPDAFCRANGDVKGRPLQ